VHSASWRARSPPCRVFGTTPETHAPKTLLGEPMGAGGALNAALALHGWQAQPGAAGPVLVNSCSLGGTNFAVVLAPYQG
jgi:3-oxoacyl-[acyl-carrier-protein] synthase II